MTTASGDESYAFEIVLHGRPDGTLPPAGLHVDAWGEWPTRAAPPLQLTRPMTSGFDEAFARLGALPRMFVEPDGSFVWTSPTEAPWWQVDGNAVEKDGRVLLVELKGSCPRSAFDRLLAAFGWPGQAMLVQLLRAAVFLDEPTFRRHAACRGNAGDGLTLRPR